ncbi:MAG: hypothetical protein O8C67_04905 [Candidatus Methanoperedens sp.]|nr:hypothetical protein [Candidatus Methanoperedens sp.]
MAKTKKVRIPRSHKGGLMVSITGKRGLHVYFQKRASAYNRCIGDAVRKNPGSVGKGSGRAARITAFTSGVDHCKRK